MKQIGLVPEFLVLDLAKSLEFYAGLLDFEVVYGREEEGFVYIKKHNVEIMLEQKGIGRNFITAELSLPFGRGVNFQIEAEDVDALYNKFLTNKLPIFIEIEEKWYRHGEMEVGNKQFCVQDPDGYLLRFYKDLGKRKI